MKALLYKEFKLAMHPMCYVFILTFPLMILIPGYPIAVGFIYVITCYPVLFLGANKGQQSNDLIYSTLLPIRKKDIVMARILTVAIMQVVFIALNAALVPLGKIIFDVANEASIASGKGPIPPTGMNLDSFVLVVSLALIGYAFADLVFLSLYYKNGRSILKATLFSIFGFAIFICLITIVPPFIPSLKWTNELSLPIQFACLGVALVVYFFIHWITYIVSAKRLEKVDF